MEETVTLGKHLGATEVFTICSGTLIGAGIFLLPGLVSAKAGPASLLCFVIAGIIASCAALSICELSTGLPMSGGGYYFISRSMGPLFGSIIGWGAIFGLAFKGAFAFVGAGDYLNALVSVKPLFFAVAFCILFMLVNISGTRKSGILQNIVVFFLLFIFALFIARGMFSIHPSNFQPFFRGGFFSFMEATGMVFITYLGLVSASAIAEEVRDPGRNLPLGILSSIIGVTILYSLVMFVTEGLIPAGKLSSTLTPLVDAAETVAGPIGTVVIVLCGLLATLSTGNGVLLTSPRYSLAMGRDNLMPEWIARINKVTKTPSRSILVMGVFMCGLILTVNLENIAKLGSTFNILLFILVNSSVIILRKTYPAWYRPEFRSPLYPWIQIAGILGSAVFIPFMGLASIVTAVSLILFGAAWFYLYGRGKALPDYGLRDALRTLRQKSLSQLALVDYGNSIGKPTRLVVPIWFTQVPMQLLILAGYLAKHYKDRARMIYCAEMPSQTLAYAAEENLMDLDLKSYLLSMEDKMKARFDMATIYAPSRDCGFIDCAGANEANLALMEWPPMTGAIHSEFSSVLRRMPCDLAILVNRPMFPLKKILVAAAHPHHDLKLQLASIFANETKAEVTVFMVFPERTREFTQGDLVRQIESMADLAGHSVSPEVVLSDNAPKKIIERARECDLLIIGSPPRVNIMGNPLGSFVEQVILETDCAVLITREDSTTKQSKWQSLLDRVLIR
ncbi:MAG: amino acid permease [Actinobacteria bacterium]|nr:amino acid permease [Actinomycetota bacterium]